MHKKERLARAVRALLAAAAVAAGTWSCGGAADLRKIFDIEHRISQGAPPRTVEQIKAGIAEYAKDAERTVKATSKVGTYYELLATRYIEMKMYRDAYDALVKAIDHFPQAAGLFYNAGYSAAFVAKAEGAKGPAGAAARDSWYASSESLYKRALEIRPDYGNALYGLAVLYSFELDRASEAVPLLAKLVQVETRNVDGMLLLGRCLYQEGKLEEAAHWFETAAATTTVAEKKAAAESARARILQEAGGVE